MVRGLEIFKEYFASYLDQYVLIGGTACTIIMEEAGLDFRATKDLDIVLYVEALNLNFISTFWEFIKRGEYQNRQRSTGAKIFYRFSSPNNNKFPVVLELFSRMADGIQIEDGGHLTPIRLNEAATSLSAILLDEEYYQFLHEGKIVLNGLSVVKASHLIPLKARAWINLIDQQEKGIHTDTYDIRKHKNDVIRLYQLLSVNERFTLPNAIKMDMQHFLILFKSDTLIDLKRMGLKNTNLKEVLNNLKLIYALDH